jgi:hypothetical protein
VFTPSFTRSREKGMLNANCNQRQYPSLKTHTYLFNKKGLSMFTVHHHNMVCLHTANTGNGFHIGSSCQYTKYAVVDSSFSLCWTTSSQYLTVRNQPNTEYHTGPWALKNSLERKERNIVLYYHLIHIGLD